MIQLTLEQKREIERVFHETPDLIAITKKVFNDESLKGSSKEGKAIRDYLLEKGLKYKTTKHKKAKPIELTEEQKALIRGLAEAGRSSFAIARELFEDRTVKKLGLEQRAVMSYIKEINPNYTQPKENSLSDYSPPNAVSRIVKRINDSTGTKLEEGKLSRQHQICIDRLGINLANSRFAAIMNNYFDQKHRDLFESEFIRLTWDKPDLTADEINLYMNACKEIINMEVISKHLNKLNEEFDDLEGLNDVTMRFAELIKTKSDEYHKCEGRIEGLTKKLQGDRAERMKKRHQNNASILSIVQLWQDEEERKNMVNLAEIQKAAVRDEANRLENMDVWLARVVGVNKDDVI